MNDKFPTISVVIPAYNSSKFIKRTIDSVINQTYKDWELIVVDDGSKDDTGEVVRSICIQNEKIRYIRQENSGSPAGPTNRGIRESKGKYIAILQHDDEWFPDKLQKQFNLITGNPDLGFVGCNAIYVNETNNSEFELRLCIPEQKDEFLEDILAANIVPFPSAILMRKQLVEENGYLDESLIIDDDWDLWIRFVAAGVNFSFIDEPLFKYHIHGGNITRTATVNKCIRDLEKLMEKHSDLYNGHLYAKAKFVLYIGMVYAESGNMAIARQIFAKSIFLNNKKLKPYILFLLSIFGVRFYVSTLNTIRYMRHPRRI